MVKIKTVKEANKEKTTCVWFGTALLIAGSVLVVVHPNPAIGVFFGILGLLLLIKMMYWQLLLRLDKSLKK